jgi:hypothetical protein
MESYKMNTEEINYPMIMFLVCMLLTAVSFYYLSITMQDSYIETEDKVLSNQTIIINGNATNQVVTEPVQTTVFNNPGGVGLSVLSFVICFIFMIIFGVVSLERS